MPNSNAFIDFDGDCTADIFLTRQNGTPADQADSKKSVKSYYEIYIQRFVTNKAGKTSQKYCLVGSQDGQIDSTLNSNTQLSNVMPLIELADFNRDSMIDLVFMQSDGTVNVLYNSYSAQGAKAETLCNDPTDTKLFSETPFFSAYPFKAGSDALV